MSSAADVVELDEERVKRGSLKDGAFSSAGEMLKASREARGMSVAEVSAATNIREMHVESIEAMAIDKLPVAAYTIGFVKAYGALMDLPVDALVARFRKEAGYATSTIAPEVVMRERRELSGGRELSLLAVVAIMAFIIWVAWQVLREPAPDGPVTISGTPMQERPINARDASFGGSNEVPLAAPTPNPDVEPIAGMPSAENDAAAAAAEVTDQNSQGDGQAVAEAPGDNPGDADPAAPGDGGETDGAQALAEADPAEADGDQEPAAENATAEQAEAVDPEEETELTEAQQLTADLNNGVVQPGDVADTASETGPEESDEESEGAIAQAEDIEASQQLIVGEAAPMARQEADGADNAVDAVNYTEPVNTARISPIYPRRCERLSTGTEQVVVTYDVSSRGQPVNLRVTQTSNECFNSAAISAVSRWQFEPATRNGNPIPAYTRSTRFRFQLPQ